MVKYRMGVVMVFDCQIDWLSFVKRNFDFFYEYFEKFIWYGF